MPLFKEIALLQSLEPSLQIVNGTQWGIIPTIDIGDLAMAVLTLGLLAIAWWSLRKASKATKKSNEATEESNRLTKESLVLTRKELHATMIPLFQFDDAQTRLIQDGDNFVVRFTAKLKNKGTVPARKIILYEFESNNTDVNDIVKEWNTHKNSSRGFGTIPQNGERLYFYDIPWTGTKQKTNWIVWCEYDYLDVKKKKTIIVFPDISAGLDTVQSIWHLHEDVIEAEKLRDNPPSA